MQGGGKGGEVGQQPNEIQLHYNTHEITRNCFTTVKHEAYLLLKKGAEVSSVFHDLKECEKTHQPLTHVSPPRSFHFVQGLRGGFEATHVCLQSVTETVIC